MSPLPTVLVSSVIRSAHLGESHGGLYLVDLATGTRRRMVDWNTCDINWAGRGLDRGLRGIAFDGEEVWVAAADELFVFDRNFRQLRSYRNRYLRHCHEIACDGDRLYLTSTGFDSVLEFDIPRAKFTHGWMIREQRVADGKLRLDYRTFEPESVQGPTAGDSIHINNVSATDGQIHVSALKLPALLRIDRTGVRQAAVAPFKTHNVQPHRGRLVLNNTGAERAELRTFDGTKVRDFSVPRYRGEDLVNGDLPEDHARQAFGRGLAVHPHDQGETLIIGSSPATLSAFDLDSGERLACWGLTMDVRNAVHGLAVWPFAVPELDPAPLEMPRPIAADAPGGEAAPAQAERTATSAAKTPA